LKIENRLGLVLTVAMFLGLFFPGLNNLPDDTALYLIASVFFVSCFKISKKEFLEISVKRSLIFYSLRFIVLPLLLFFICQAILPQYATGVFLLSLMPAGIASPSVSGVMNGNLTMALSLVLVSSVAAPFVVPLMFYFTHPPVEGLDLNRLFVILSCVIFIPLLLHLPLRHLKTPNAWLIKNNKLLSVLLLGSLTIAVVAVQREKIISQWFDLGFSLLLLSLLYCFYYFWGWFVPPGKRRQERVTFATCSGVNNNALGISLALTSFPDQALFLVLTSLPWVLGTIIFTKRIGQDIDTQVLPHLNDKGDGERGKGQDH
jgi:predicted Na+-dependent transporter